MDRRAFLKKGLKAAALLSLPNFVSNCGSADNLDSVKPKYLIINSDSLDLTVKELADFRKSDYDVEQLRISDISTRPDSNQLRQFLVSYAGANPSLKHILFVGPTDSVPTFLVPYIQSANEIIPTDFYYSNIVSDGNLPDLSVGRIPSRDIADLEVIIEKIKSFRPRKLEKVLLFGDGYELSVGGQQHKESLKQKGYNANLIEETGSQQNDLANTAAEMNKNVDSAVHYGHSTRFFMYPFVNKGSVPRLTGDNFILFSGGCDVMNFAEPLAPDPEISKDLCLGYMFLKNQNGSVASIGATKLGGYGYGYSFIDGFFDKVEEGATIGDLFLNGLAHEAKKIESDDSLSMQEKNALLNTMGAFSKRAVLLGDPALKIIE